MNKAYLCYVHSMPSVFAYFYEVEVTKKEIFIFYSISHRNTQKVWRFLTLKFNLSRNFLTKIICNSESFLSRNFLTKMNISLSKFRSQPSSLISDCKKRLKKLICTYCRTGYSGIKNGGLANFICFILCLHNISVNTRVLL